VAAIAALSSVLYAMGHTRHTHFTSGNSALPVPPAPHPELRQQTGGFNLYRLNLSVQCAGKTRIENRRDRI
jgi:hypothetical protein